MDNGASSYRRFLDGDKDAFGEIVDLYRENLIYFIFRYVKSIDVAEDLAEDTFVELIVHPKAYKFKASLKTFLFTVGRNKAIDYVRKHSRVNLCTIEAAEELADIHTLEESVLKTDDAKAVNEAMATLSEDYRLALHLVYFEDLSYEETAKIMKKNRKQVENFVYRGKIALRNILEKEVLADENKR